MTHAGGPIPGSRMTHSLSTPGVDGSTSHLHLRGGKKLAIRVQMLDDSVTLFQVQVSIFLILIFYTNFFHLPFRLYNTEKRTRETSFFCAKGNKSLKSY